MSPTPCIDLGMSLLILSATTMRSSQTFRSNYPNKFCKSVVHSRMLCRVLVRIKDIGPCQGKMPRMCKTGSLILKVQPMHEVGANKKYANIPKSIQLFECVSVFHVHAQ